MADPTARIDPDGHYRTLGVDPLAAEAEIRRAFRAAAKALHPDLHRHPAAASQFARLRASYEFLIDPGRRAAYDRSFRHLLVALPAPQRRTTPAGQHLPSWWLTHDGAAPAGVEAHVARCYLNAQALCFVLAPQVDIRI